MNDQFEAANSRIQTNAEVSKKQIWQRKMEWSLRKRALFLTHLLRCVSWTRAIATKRLAAYISIAGSGHQSPGLWRHPEDESWLFNDVDHWVELAKLLEKAKFHGIFIADVLGKFLSSYQLGSNASKVATMCTTHLWILQSYLVLNGPSTNLLP
jgi:hypothetical protein